MGKYCCFCCPTPDYAEKRLEERCPTCGREYGFMLSKPPTTVGEYAIVETLGRGFYGAAYIAERGRFKKKVVLKVSPTEFYNGLKKNFFEEETDLHNQLAQHAEYVVGIDDTFEADVEFADEQKTTLRCHVIVLDYIDGNPLEDYLEGRVALNVRATCQVAIDLLKMRSEFEAHQLNHNDLHANNLIVQKLDPKARRVNALDGSIRVMAIDLGSIAEDSKSTDQRHGDLYFIAQHVDRLLDRLLADPSSLVDRDYRVALALQGIVRGCLAPPQNARQPGLEDLVKQIVNAHERATQPWRPWATPLQLSGFGDHYNAQTLASWGVPRLLVDPEGRWLNEVARPGPQIITGMRGCGKTMLLRALDFHARAVKANDAGSTDKLLEGLRKDGYVGLFVSAQRLLDLRDSVSKLEHRLTRLFASYALQASRALLHLQNLSPEAVAATAHLMLGNTVADYLNGGDELRSVTSIDELELRLNKIVVLTARIGSGYLVEQASAQAFPHLAEQLRLCSPVWQDSQVFFLLDDVSTRYIEVERVEELLTSLLFQSTVCAFKFTSEWQTIELGLRSPGRIHPVRIDRDVSVFDLGSLVHQTINGTGEGKGTDFISRVLQQRAELYPDHPAYSPKQLLGDVSLEQVAREIAAANATSKDRKQVYRGLSCVTNVCVGDIGDVIKLYEEIIKRATTGKMKVDVPIAAGIQSECFQQLSSQRLYELNRRAGKYKDHALAFAAAANEELVKSYRQTKKPKNGQPRLRQYSSIYVRVTSDDKQKLRQQIDQLRDLIDAGVFVYTGGAARTKTKDSNPIQQFKLSYRKICGLAAFIGLADRDRFELSGEDLEQWLNAPDKSVLLKNLSESRHGAGDEEAASSDMEDKGESTPEEPSEPPAQAELFEHRRTNDGAPPPEPMDARVEPIDARISLLSEVEFEALRIDSVLAGLGFEERTLESNRFIARHSIPKKVQLIRYEEPGYSQEILAAWKATSAQVEVYDYPNLLAQIPEDEGLVLVDVSGLSKPLIFSAVRRELMAKGRVLVGHMRAEFHYPLDEDLRDLLEAERANDPLRLLESLAGVLKGESGPYKSVRLLEEETDQSRNRALIAFASAKHERLFSLMDRREFDMVDVMAPNDDEPRAKVANYAAEFLCKGYPSASLEKIDVGNLESLVQLLDRRYLELYLGAGANVEVGRTGSKVQAVASAIVSSKRKLAQVWYLKPAKFDVSRFSKGVKHMQIYDIRLDDTDRGD